MDYVAATAYLSVTLQALVDEFDEVNRARPMPLGDTPAMAQARHLLTKIEKVRESDRQKIPALLRRQAE